MVRLATVSDYPAVSDLLSSYPRFSQRIKGHTFFPITAMSSIAMLSTLKIAVVVDNTKQIVGCMLLDEDHILLNVSHICILPFKNCTKILEHMLDFVVKYIEDNNYPGFSITVDNEKYQAYLQSEYKCTASFYEGHKGIGLYSMTSANKQIVPLNRDNMSVLSKQTDDYIDFSSTEGRNLIYVASHSAGNVAGMLDRYHGITSSELRENCDTVNDMINYMNTKPNLYQYLLESLSKKLVLVENGQVAGFIAFNTSAIHHSTIEITNLYIAPKYLNEQADDVIDQLVQSACRYGAKRGAKFLHCKWLAQPGYSQIGACFSRLGVITDALTMVFIFDDNNQVCSLGEQVSADESHTSVFS